MRQMELVLVVRVLDVETLDGTLVRCNRAGQDANQRFLGKIRSVEANHFNFVLRPQKHR